MFIQLLTFLFQVSADYTIDERLCFLVCDGYHFCSVVPLWALSFLFSSAIVNCGFVTGPTISKATISKVWTVVWNDICVIWALWSLRQSACQALRLNIQAVAQFAFPYGSAINKHCIIERSESRTHLYITSGWLPRRVFPQCLVAPWVFHGFLQHLYKNHCSWCHTVLIWLMLEGKVSPADCLLFMVVVDQV